MDEVYIVTNGECSDYRIRGVFTSREAAEAYARLINGKVEPWEVDVPKEEWTQVAVGMNRQGQVGHSVVEHSLRPEPGFRWYGRADYFVWVVVTDNEERAVKVVNEKRAQIIAAGVWGDNEATRKLFGHKPPEEG